jgi:hypothetical protein
MYKIEIQKIEAGDIILTRSSSRESLLIREITKCEYSHAILYVGVGSCIESDGLGVQSQNLQRLLFENPEDVVILRLKENKTPIAGAIVFARQKIGTEYSTSEARLARLEKEAKAKENNRQFCTRFVAQSYENAGIKIVENPDYCSPQEILESKSLIKIDNVVTVASKAEIDFVNEKDNPLEKQIEIHNLIFEKIRNLSGEDIQTFEQIGKYVLENPKIDNEISEIIKESGYLEMWKHDVDKNPWHYNYKEFLLHYKNPNQRKEIGYFFASTESQTRERFLTTLKTLKFGYSFYGQNYFKMQIELYYKLIELSHEREFVGILALKN